MGVISESKLEQPVSEDATAIKGLDSMATGPGNTDAEGVVQGLLMHTSPKKRQRNSVGAACSNLAANLTIRSPIGSQINRIESEIAQKSEYP